MDKQEKRLLMEQRKKRWMDDRNRNLTREEGGREAPRELSQSLNQPPLQAASNHNRPGSSGGSRGSAPGGGSRYSAWVQEPAGSVASSSSARALSSPAGVGGSGDDAFLNKLTEKLTLHIREEVQKEMYECVSGPRAKDVVVEKMDSYLQDELHTHVCKICFQVMTSPDHTPKLLFPCGHTFCSACLDDMTGRTSKASWKCPYCRQGVESIAVNQSLKELIDRFARQKSEVRHSSSNTVALGDVFPSASGHSSGRASSEPGRAPAGAPRTAAKYQAAYQAAEMRRGILSNELEDAMAEGEAVRKRKLSLNTASAHLTAVRSEVVEKIKLLNEELVLIDSHLEEQKEKKSELEKHEDSVHNKVELLKKTIAGIKSDMERMLLLAEGSALA